MAETAYEESLRIIEAKVGSSHLLLGPELSETWSTFLEMLSLGLFEMRWYAEKARVLA